MEYGSSRTVAGALRRGLGRGAFRAVTDPAGAELVVDCLRRDWRWDWLVDERDVYLARLVRDLRIPVERLSALLFGAPARKDDGAHSFVTVLGVMDVLGRAGVDGAVEEVRRYIATGSRWVEALDTVAGSWPMESWDDLYPAVVGRLDETITADAVRRGPPWDRWAQRDPRIAARIEAFEAQARPAVRRFAGAPEAELFALLADRERVADWQAALRELNRRPPDPRLLDLVDGMVGVETSVALGVALNRLGARSLPAVRRWVADPAHPLIWTAYRLLAAYGETADEPLLLAGLDWLDSRPDDLCGYDQLVTGLARLGSEAALPRIRRLWYSPHSYERPAYLRALVALDPAGAERFVTEGLWDCESDVRLLAAERTPLTAMTRERLGYLRDDPMETDDVRAAAGKRLVG